MGNPFVHVELNTTDTAKAKEFYGSLFDWTLEDVSMGVMGTYTLIKVGNSKPAEAFALLAALGIAVTEPEAQDGPHPPA